MHCVGRGAIPCQLEEQCQHEQPPRSVGTSKELHFPNSSYDLQNCVRDQYRVLNWFKARICFDRLGFWEMYLFAGTLGWSYTHSFGASPSDQTLSPCACPWEPPDYVNFFRKVKQICLNLRDFAISFCRDVCGLDIDKNIATWTKERRAWKYFYLVKGSSFLLTFLSYSLRRN